MLNTVHNTGTVASSPSTTRFLWSTDTVIDAGDYLLDRLTGRAFACRRRLLQHVRAVADHLHRRARGGYYFAACADYPSTSPSRSRRTTAVLGYRASVHRADLLVTDVSGFPATVNADASFDVTDTIVNPARGSGKCSRTRTTSPPTRCSTPATRS